MCCQDKHHPHSVTTCRAAIAARGELLASSAAIDAAEARWQAFAVAEYRRGRAEGEALAELARAEGYAEAVAEAKAAEHGIYRHLAAQGEADRARWVVRGEARTREAFGAPHPGDYRGGPVAWPELGEAESAVPVRKSRRAA